MTTAIHSRRRQKIWTLSAFVVCVVSAGFLIGFFLRPDEWYRSLEKPAFNPPDWVFAPVWAVVYVLIAIAGWRTWLRKGDSAALAIWVAQMSANYMWTPAFFGLHSTRLGLVVIATLFCLIFAFIANRWSADRRSALLFVPYACWVAFATTLNAAVWWLNPVK